MTTLRQVGLRDVTTAEGGWQEVEVFAVQGWCGMRGLKISPWESNVSGARLSTCEAGRSVAWLCRLRGVTL